MCIVLQNQIMKDQNCSFGYKTKQNLTKYENFRTTTALLLAHDKLE